MIRENGIERESETEFPLTFLDFGRGRAEEDTDRETRQARDFLSINVLSVLGSSMMMTQENDRVSGHSP
jgi:hypothetical protein